MGSSGCFLVSTKRQTECAFPWTARVVLYKGSNPIQMVSRQHAALEVGARPVRDAAMTEAPFPGDAQGWEPARTVKKSWWDGGVTKDGAEHSYRAQGQEHAGGTLSFSITQINSLPPSLASKRQSGGFLTLAKTNSAQQYVIILCVEDRYASIVKCLILFPRAYQYIHFTMVQGT